MCINMFAASWSALVTYRPVLGVWPEAVYAENAREIITPTGSAGSRRPGF
jgi:hypothetical protein